MAIEINDRNFNQIINSNKVVLVDFSATWCGPCKALSPVIDQLSQEYNGRAVIGKLDIERSPSTTAQFGIRSVPALLFFKNGQLVHKQAGGQRVELSNKINSLL